MSTVADPRLLGLPELWDEVPPARFPAHTLRYRNDAAAAEVGLQTLSDSDWIAHFGRFEPLPNNLPKPLALRYHGHQFQHYNPRLGDGRGFTFAQVRDTSGRLMDLGTKGSGTTPYSRGGDGRLTLKGGVREILATEMLSALGVDTSRTFSLIETGESLYRGDEPSPTRSSVLVRLSHGHIRIGSFQRLAALGQRAEMGKLLTYVCDNLLGITATPEHLLDVVVARTARTTAQWMAAGFVHGVLNTDNINITGESFDYGPWRFLTRFDPEMTAAYFDESGLYAYGRQAEAVFWNLCRLRDALGTLATVPESVLHRFGPLYRAELRAAFLHRMGLQPLSVERDDALLNALFAYLEHVRAPFDTAMFDTFGGVSTEPSLRSGPRAALYTGDTFDTLRAAWQGHSPRMVQNPEYWRRDAPVTMAITTVERVWDAIAAEDDWGPLKMLLGQVRELGGALGDKV